MCFPVLQMNLQSSQCILLQNCNALFHTKTDITFLLFFYIYPSPIYCALNVSIRKRHCKEYIYIQISISIKGNPKVRSNFAYHWYCPTFSWCNLFGNVWNSIIVILHTFSFSVNNFVSSLVFLFLCSSNEIDCTCAAVLLYVVCALCSMRTTYNDIHIFLSDWHMCYCYLFFFTQSSSQRTRTRKYRVPFYTYAYTYWHIDICNISRHRVPLKVFSQPNT